MNHSAAEVLRSALITLDGGETSTLADSPAWSMFVDTEPTTPDKCITIQDTDGVLDGTDQINGEMYDRNGIQIRVRSDSHTTGFVRAILLRDLIDRSILRTAVTIGASTYIIHSVTRQGTIISLGKEPKTQRHLFTINALMIYRQTN